MVKTIESLEDFLGQAVLVKTTEQYPNCFYAGVLEQFDDKIFILSLWSHKNGWHQGYPLSPIPNFEKSNFGNYAATQRNKQKLRKERDPKTDLVLLRDKVVSIYGFTNIHDIYKTYKGYEI
jgi:hypothetical protein